MLFRTQPILSTSSACTVADPVRLTRLVDADQAMIAFLTPLAILAWCTALSVHASLRSFLVVLSDIIRRTQIAGVWWSLNDRAVSLRVFHDACQDCINHLGEVDSGLLSLRFVQFA